MPTTVGDLFSTSRRLSAEQDALLAEARALLVGKWTRTPDVHPFEGLSGRRCRVQSVGWFDGGLMVTVEVERLDGNGFLDSSNAHSRRYVSIEHFSSFEARGGQPVNP